MSQQSHPEATPAAVVDNRTSRRGVLSAAGAGALAVGLGSATLSGTASRASAAARSVGHMHHPHGPGSVSGAPHLSSSFRRTFKSHFVDVGDVRLHAAIGGHGRPLLLVHGWPQTWYAWRMVMPALARHFQVIAVDQRGIGLSDKPADGYDTATIANDLVALMEALGHKRFPVYGTDTGMPIAYAVAADHRDRVERLIVSEAFLPGIGDPIPLFVPPPLNARLWHLMFNQLPPEVNEAMIRGREEIFFGAEFDAAAGATKLPSYAVNYYVRMLQDERDDLRGSFGFYRAFWDSYAQDIERQKNPLTLPVLAMGGNESGGTGPGLVMQQVASDVLTKVVTAGHWVAEQAPAEILSEVESFLAPLHHR